MKSIIQVKKECYLCRRLGIWPVPVRNLDLHHIYPGPNRKISDKNGFTCYLCKEHHTFGPNAVHDNIIYLRMLQQDCQQEYEKNHSRSEFMALIGRNYLD